MTDSGNLLLLLLFLMFWLSLWDCCFTGGLHCLGITLPSCLMIVWIKPGGRCCRLHLKKKTYRRWAQAQLLQMRLAWMLQNWQRCWYFPNDSNKEQHWRLFLADDMLFLLVFHWVFAAKICAINQMFVTVKIARQVHNVPHSFRIFILVSQHVHHLLHTRL